MKTTLAKSEIHGAVWKVLVQPGQVVAAGDTLVLIESMKMEIPVLADEPGRVQAIHVAEGDTVSPGQLVATLEH